MLRCGGNAGNACTINAGYWVMAKCVLVLCVEGRKRGSEYLVGESMGE